MSDRVMSFALTAVLLVLVLAAGVTALDFNEQARRVPLVVAVPTAIALMIQVVREFLGAKLGAEFADAKVDDEGPQNPVAGAVATTGVLDVSAEAGPASKSDFTADADDDQPAATAPSTTERAASGGKTERTEIVDAKVSPPQAFAWIAFLFVSFYLVGMMLTVPLFIVPFMRFYGQESWKMIAGVVLGTMGVLYVMFVRLLEVRLYTGVFGESLGL